MKTDETIALEKAFQIPTYNKLPIALVRGEGPHVWDADGKQYIDFYGGHCVTLIGHCPPRVVASVQRQVSRLIFYSNLVYSPVRADACRMIAELAPAGRGNVFFCNSGTEANETALKIARKWTGKPRIIAMERDFHGRTLGSLAVTHGAGYRKPYEGVLAPTTFVPLGDLEALERTLHVEDDVAGVILEPIQSMAGMWEASAAYYRGVRHLCNRRDVVLIFDEVQTGVGRTGTFSVSEHYGMVPDVITLAKSLGSGIPVGATLVCDTIASTIEPGDQGTTFGGGMIAMAALMATLETIVDEGLMERAAEIRARIVDGLGAAVESVRGRGCLLGVTLSGPAKPFLSQLLDAGAIAGGSGEPNTIRLMPPLNTPLTVVDHFCRTFRDVLAHQPPSTE